MEDIIVKYADINIYKELISIGFDKKYLENAKKKYSGKAYKVFNLKPYEANILKQLSLSLGFDCAVNRGTITCSCDYTDAVIFASNYQYLKLCEKLKQQPFRLKNLAYELESVLNSSLHPLITKNFVFDWKMPYVMGILNVTPDSFSDGGKYLNIDDAVDHAIKLIQDGADIIDIGGESTRPEAKSISVDEEISRIIPVIKKLRENGILTPISVDTRNYETAKAAVEAGVDIINDVSGFDYDENLLNYVCKNNIPCVVMHSDSVPANMNDFTCADIVEEVYKSLHNKIEKMYKLGLAKENIIADTGIGFGKSRETCFEILKRHEEFLTLGVPMLLGISRKSFIRDKFNLSCIDADIPTAIYSTIVKGVNIHRVHNVKLAKDYLTYSGALNS